jgi:GNAT superfamily N-acetyltransferase
VPDIGMSDSTLEIHPLVAARLADFLAFFDGDAFIDNPSWSSCYCQCFYEDHATVNWAARTAGENRTCAVERIAGGRMQGLLAYRKGRVVGWCNVAPRAMLHALDGEPIPDCESIGTILCFLVAPSGRGQGVATALLAAACEHLRAAGSLVAEANPRPTATSAADNHFGPLAMYLRAGFTVQRTDHDGSVWVKKTLHGSGSPSDE